MPGQHPNPTDVLPLCRESFAAYALAINPAYQLVRHTEFLCELCERIERGELRRVCLSLPPQHSKSETCLRLFIPWFLGRHPERSVIAASYGAELIEASGRRIRDTLASDIHRAIFPECQLSESSAAMNRVELTAGGSAYFVGRGGALTGRPASGITILDDMLKDWQEASSPTIKRALWDWFRTVAYTRLGPDAAVLIIGTRWAEDDLQGMLLREHAGEGWVEINLPAIAEAPATKLGKAWSFLRGQNAGDPLGRAEGEALWPEKYPIETLQSIRRTMSGSMFTSLYQGHPSAATGAVFRREWFRYYREMPSCQKIIQAWDTASGTKASNDYSVCVTLGTNNAGVYLLNLWRARVEFPQLKRQVAEQAQAWKPHAILVESAGPSGMALLQELKASTPFPTIGCTPVKDKRLRAELILALYESGRVFSPAEAPWLAAFEDELLSFPVGSHDDQVDGLVHGLTYLREASMGYDMPPPFLPGLLQATRPLTGNAAQASARIAAGEGQPDDLDVLMNSMLNEAGL